eukprot:9468189-Alexandrium_andersonii.AAC.1
MPWACQDCAVGSPRPAPRAPTPGASPQKHRRQTPAAPSPRSSGATGASPCPTDSAPTSDASASRNALPRISGRSPSRRLAALPAGTA